MTDSKIPRSLTRSLESGDTFPLRALEGIRELRGHLDHIEEDALCRARELGASITEIADVMGMTRQGVYNKLKHLADRDKAEALAEAEARS